MQDKKQKGSALLMVLVITTIIASIATMMLFTQRQYIKQSQAWQTQQHMRHAASYAMPWALQTLQQPLNTEQNMPTLYHDGMRIDASLVDLASDFNLNWLSEADAKPVLTRLIMQLNTGLSAQQARAISQAITDHHPHRHQANTLAPSQPPWIDPAQLNQLHSIDAVTLKELQAHSQALPTSQRWNLNSIPPRMLQILWPGISESDTKKFTECRKKSIFHSLDDAKSCLPISTQWSHVPAGIGSHYARLRITVQQQKQQLTLVRDLHHEQKNVRIFRQYDSIETP